MYDNIGGKIKKLAEVLGWIFIGGGVIAALALWLDMDSFLLGFIALIAGGLMYVTTWVMYGFGQLVEDVAAIRSGKTAPQQAPADAGDDLPEI